MANIKNSTESIEVRLGADAKFPIAGTFESIKGLDVLLQDIQALLLTMPGERPFRPEYGCNLGVLLWENSDSIVLDGSAAIREALDRYEPRIEVTGVSGNYNDNTGLATFKIQFIVIETDVNVNLIFPFRTNTSLSFA